MKEFDSKELAKYNGENGSPAYIAHKGKVYDVTGSKLWAAGTHMRRHRAGTNLTTDIQAAPHGPEILERYSQVGTLKEETAETAVALPKILAILLESNPFFRRHPHPMTVHFPIVFMLSTPFFNVLYLITGIKSFELTALHCLAGGILFTLVAMSTGVLTWWYNYLGKMLRPVAVKIPLTIVMLITGIVAFVWRINDPGVLDPLQGTGIVYLLLILSLAPLTAVIGWYGASMTFPIEKQ
ncbi:MAG: cytochrome b5 [Deltaproteobacteria bacterium SG8_13]|nr:MAG: cytochrome b5 [Deltaproteobacteria bacterium SG8_13]